MACGRKTYPFKAVIFEGAGTGAFGHAGALREFERVDALRDVKYFIGSSSGGIVAAALSLGADSEMMINILNETDFNKFLDNSFGFIRDTYRLFTKYGWNRGAYIEKWFGEALEKICGNSEITFKEAYEQTGNFLVITTANLTTGFMLYMSHETTPDLPIKRAIRRTTALPLVFKPDAPLELFDEDRELKQCYVDGGLLNNYPLDYFDDILSSPEEAVGFKIMSSAELNEVTNPYVDVTNPTYPNNIKNFMLRTFIMVINKNFKIHVPEKDWARTVKIDAGTHSSIKFNLTESDKEYLLNQGRVAAQEYLRVFNETF